MLGMIDFHNDTSIDRLIQAYGFNLWCNHGIKVCRGVETNKFAIAGKTFEYKDVIKASGGKWDKLEKT